MALYHSSRNLSATVYFSITVVQIQHWKAQRRAVFGHGRDHSLLPFLIQTVCWPRCHPASPEAAYAKLQVKTINVKEVAGAL